MKVSNEVYKKVTIDWANVTLPLKEGSPVSSAGVVANSGSAFGIVPQAYKEEPLEKSIYVLVGGHVDLNEIETLYGSTYDDAAISALNGIHFYKNGASVPSASGGGTLVVTQTETQEDVYVLNKTWKEIHDAMVNGYFVTLVKESDGEVGQEIFYSATIGDTAKPYTVTTMMGNSYYAETQNDYPSSDDGGESNDDIS